MRAASIFIRNARSCSSVSSRSSFNNRSTARQLIGALSEAARKNVDIEVCLDRFCRQSLDAASVVSVLESVKDVNLATRFFDWASQQPGFAHNSKSYGALIRVFVRAGQHQEAYQFIKEQSLQPSSLMHAYLALIKGYACAGEPPENVNKLRKEAIGLGYAPSAIANCVLEGTCARDISEGLELLKRMKKPDDIPYNVVMCHCFRVGRLEDAFRCIDSMAAHGCSPTTVTYGTILDGLMRAGRLDEAYQFFQDMDKSDRRYTAKVEIGASLISGLINARRCQEAVQVHDRLLCKGAKFRETTYRHIILQLCERQKLEEASQIFYKMEERGCKPDNFTATVIVERACALGRLEEALGILHYSIQIGSYPQGVVYSQLIEALCKENRLEEATSVLQMRIDRGCLLSIECSYAFIIKAYCKMGKLEEALVLLDRLIEGGGQATEQMCFPLVDSLCRASQMDEALKIYKRLTHRSSSIGKLIVDALCKSGRMKEATVVFEDMIANGGTELEASDFHGMLAGLFRLNRVDDAFKIVDLMVEKSCPLTRCTYNIIIDGLCKAGRCSEALDVFEKIAPSGNVITYGAFIHGLCKAGKLEDGLKLYNQMPSRGFYPDSVLHSIVIDGLCKAGRVSEAQELLHRLLDQGEVVQATVYNALITGLMDGGRIDEGLATFHLMMKRNCCPDPLTFGIAMKGLCRANRLEEAYQLLQDVIAEEDTHSKKLLGELAYIHVIAGLFKAGQLDRAIQLFRQVKDRRVQLSAWSYNTIISALGDAGRDDELREIFKDMLASGCIPNKFTYGAIKKTMTRGDLESWEFACSAPE